MKSLTKKLLLLVLAMSLSTHFYAQDAKVEKTKKEVKTRGATKTTKKVADKTESAAKKTGKAVEKTSDKVADKTKKTAKQTKKAVAKTEAKAEKVAKDAKTETKKAAKKVETKTKKTTAKVRETNEKAPKTPDKVTGTYNGKKVYTGPRGGRYYINKNGNKTYIQD